MKVSIRWKLFASYLFLLLVMGGMLFLYLNRTLDNVLVEGVRSGLRGEVQLAALLVERAASGWHSTAPQLATEIGQRVRARVTLIDDNGTVLGDSQLVGAELRHMENHRDRPEVQDALRFGVGSAVRYSATVGTRMLYVALPVATTPAGVVRLALPLTSIDAAKHNLHTSLIIAFALALFLAIGLSLLLTQVTARVLENLSDGARRFGAGDFRTRVPVVSNDELGTLAQVMNEMAQRLQEQMEHLALERNRLDAILRGMGEGVLVTDNRGQVLLVNPALRAMFTLPGEVVGRPLADISRHPQLNETCRAVLASQAEQIREIVVQHDSERTLLTHWVPLREQTAVVGVVAVFHDISELKRLELIRRDFVANVSHELRTPVTVIKGYAETLTPDFLATNPGESARFVTMMHNHAERLATLIGDLLALSELEADGFALNLAPVPLAPLLHGCCALVADRVAAREQKLDLEAAPELLVLADRQRLEQVMLNLLDNAVNYTPPGGAITVRAAVQGAFVAVAVSDNGIGIPPQAVARIFERFYRVDPGRSRAAGGTGLGLAIVKHLVQLHGGSVQVTSTPGQGSTFTVLLRQGSAGAGKIS